jgi:hypothetical protein
MQEYGPILLCGVLRRPPANRSPLRGKLPLLQSAFSDTLDEYPNVYSVYELPESTEPLLAAGSWRFLEQTALTSIGEIPINAVEFDSTKRKSMNASILDPLLDH